MRSKGRVTQWREDKGFGFIAPSEGGAQVFFHINDFARRVRRPAINDWVTYEVVKAPDGRFRATQLRFTDDRTKLAASESGRVFAPFVVLLFLGLLAGLVVTRQLPGIILALYLGMSGLAFGAYAWDKASAQSGRWRTQESTLLLIGLIGGWPGALIAQKILRHKSKKRQFILAFWVTVLINCCTLVFLLYGEGNSLLELLGFALPR